MNKIKLIEKVEGEATLDIKFKDEKIEFVEIKFFDSRGIENILKGRPALDSLVINPRVCGICGHAHLIASVKALEDCLNNFKLPKNAEILRELTLNFEIIQNHFKWFYLTLLPLFEFKQYVLKATTPSQTIAKAIATIAGQYPHTSYALPGGVANEITSIDIAKIKALINEVLSFFEKEIVKADTKELVKCENVLNLLKKEGDLPTLLNLIVKNGWQSLGKSYDRFIVFGENSYFQAGKSLKTRVTKSIKLNFVKEEINQNSKAKNVTYKSNFYEVGPLSRAMLNKTKLIKDSHRRFADSIFSRIVARVCEIPQLLHHSLEILKQIDINKEFYKEPKEDITKITSYGVGLVEAARGSLIHKVELENGLIKNYEIITPTQWNLSNGTLANPGVAQKAMIGLDSVEVAEIVFKTFDVCSVCTTQ